MNEIRYTLLSEGTSDRALMPVLSWLFQKHLPQYAVQDQWADLARLPKPPKSLAERICLSIELYSCDLLFVHRDADNQGRDQRVSEITRALQTVKESTDEIPLICIIPVRMTEAWLLFDEAAIRNAAENPKGTQALAIPNLMSIEQHTDPKATLHHVLQQASGATGRRLKKFKSRMGEKVQRVAELIDDFSPLRYLEAFQALENDIIKFIEQHLSER